MIEIIPVTGLPVFQHNDNIAQILVNHFDFKEKDVLVIAHTIVSRVEGCEIKLDKVIPSPMATKIAQQGNKDPRVVEVILQESKSIVRMSSTLLIAETKHGLVCANAAVDRSNAKPGHVLILPKDPDLSAQKILNEIIALTDLKKLGVIISDTFGRPFRIGTTNVAIGIAGLQPLYNYAGRKDLFGYEMQYTTVAKADELATAAGLIMGQADEGIPAAIIRGVDVSFTNTEVTAKLLNRKREDALFW